MNVEQVDDRWVKGYGPECAPLSPPAKEGVGHPGPPTGPPSEPLHVTHDNLRLGAVLGEGEFGVVRSAQMRRVVGAPWRTVAVKMLKGRKLYRRGYRRNENNRNSLLNHRFLIKTNETINVDYKLIKHQLKTVFVKIYIYI